LQPIRCETAIAYLHHIIIAVSNLSVKVKNIKNNLRDKIEVCAGKKQRLKTPLDPEPERIRGHTETSKMSITLNMHLIYTILLFNLIESIS
jgi:hypothetical protein